MGLFWKTHVSLCGMYLTKVRGLNFLNFFLFWIRFSSSGSHTSENRWSGFQSRYYFKLILWEVQIMLFFVKPKWYLENFFHTRSILVCTYHHCPPLCFFSWFFTSIVVNLLPLHVLFLVCAFLVITILFVFIMFQCFGVMFWVLKPNEAVTQKLC